MIFFKNDRLTVKTQRPYQAVFLDNGQVYFGKLKSVSRDFFSLTNIFYLRAGTIQNATSTLEQKLDLIKLGLELHRPRDEMVINKSHVIFYEDLGSDSQVMEYIRGYRK